MKKFLIPMLIATTTAAPLMATVSCAPKKAESFINDSWETVCYYAKKGLDKLHEAYQADCDANTDFPGTLVGLERKVIINGLEHTVKVVGEEQDYLDEDHEEPVTLTFQFTNLISGSDKKFVATYWQADGQRHGAHYWNSKLNDALNSSDDVEWWSGDKDGHIIEEKRSVYKMIKDENKALAKNIKSVNRAINVDPSESLNWVVANHSTKLFCPTLSNYYSNFGLWNGRTINYLSEGQQYQYYASAKKIGSKSAGNSTCQDLIFNDISNKSMKYWLTTACLSANEQAFVLENDNGKGTYGVIITQGSNHRYAVAPCFCI